MGNENYFAHGGRELVIGGKLTFLPGATVEGAEGLFDLPTCADGGTVQLDNVPECTGTNVSAVRTTLNQLLAALKKAGLMVADEAGDEA